IQLTVERPSDGAAEQENYSLRPENFHLPAIEFTDKELAALQTALSLLDGEFAYAEPLRLALQQITWGRPSPLRAPEQSSVALGITGSAGGHELTARLAKIETAIFRNKTILFDYYTMERDEEGPRKVDPYHLIFQGGQFYLLGYSHERKAIRVFRLSRIRGKVSYATKAEHDFRRPADFDPRGYANRADWQLGEELGVAEIQVSERIAWQVERHFGRYGEIRHDDGETVFLTSYSNPRGIVSWVLGLGGNARLLGPEELVREFDRRLELLQERHREGALAAAASAARAPGEDKGSTAGNASAGRSRAERRAEKADAENGRAEAAIRPERFARLVTLASILIRAGRAGEPVSSAELREGLQLSDEELREDVNVLNVVNFGGGSYVLYAEIKDDGEIEVDPEPYSDNFDRPARLLPVEAKALVAAIDLIGEHLPEGSLTSAREKIVAALGEDPMDQGLQVAPTGADDSDVARLISKAIAQHKMIELEYYKENEDELTARTVEPYALTNGREGWYVASFDPTRDGVRHFRLDRIKEVTVTGQRFKPRPEVDPAAEVDGWLRTGEVPASAMARVWISPERARWARESRRVVGECRDGAVIVELSFAGVDWLVREVLKEAGDAAVIEPVEAREAILAAVARVREASSAAAVA
ncbi:MAG TPA: WYL domain-containing protein, partial [Solirubrobacteraceae bacterium]|nr:WYL domain-containing protein [Solirubrobacteraceae bacterium]